MTRYKYAAWLPDGSKLVTSFDADHVYETAQKYSRENQVCVDVTSHDGTGAAGRIMGHWAPRSREEYSRWVTGRMARK